MIAVGTEHLLIPVSDLADTFPNGQYANHFREGWLQAMIKEVRQNKEYSPRTHETARWAKEQVKRQIQNAQ